MSEHKIMDTCFMCGSPFQMGPHLYEGEFIRHYQVSICSTCYKGNWDGWAPHYEHRLVAHLKKNGLPIPERNAKGWLPRD